MIKRKKDHLALGDALQEFIQANKLEKGIDQVKVRDVWASLMGNGVNNYTTSVVLRNGTLYIGLSSSVLRSELSHGRSKIITMLNEELGKDLIQKIILR